MPDRRDEMDKTRGVGYADGFDFDRLYAFRHRNVDQARRQRVWDEIARYLYALMGHPSRVLDPAAGRGEFINAIPATERWVVDAVEYQDARYPNDVKVVIGDALTVDLPHDYFDGMLISNLLEHFSSHIEIGRFLRRMLRTMAPGGRLVVLGPNFRYCAKDYFDCADHTMALTEKSLQEHLHVAGFEVDNVIPRFLPFSFSGRLPNAPILVRAYLRLPLAWRVLGRQFLVVAHRPS